MSLFNHLTSSYIYNYKLSHISVNLLLFNFADINKILQTI